MTTQQRVLPFPMDRSLGDLYILNDETGVKYIGQARGRVTVDEGSLVKLSINDPLNAYLSPLDALRADDLAAVSLYSAYVSSASMSHLSRMTGLIELDLGYTRVIKKLEAGIPSSENIDSLLWYIRKLTNLRILKLGHIPLTDQGMNHLMGLKKLEVLDLEETKISDQGLACLAELSELKVLDLQGIKAGGQGLKALARLKKLQSLDLQDTKVDDKAAQFLSQMNQLKWLRLKSTMITDDGMQHLAGMTALTELELDDNNITDFGLIHLSGMTQLTELDVSYTKITDAGLHLFYGLVNLKSVGLKGLGLSEGALNDLRQALPGCQLVTS
ncbi:MAG: hypothetical protein IT343_11045 [Candidatus Melainabacteria bacterium]|jgi:Leucine-rich repeat (LRR) protein|nr:hypothetical protein [Candidatus Melainabacteria bacterium]